MSIREEDQQNSQQYNCRHGRHCYHDNYPKIDS